MVSNIKTGKFGIEGKVRFELFGVEINVLINKEVDMEYAESCACNLNCLPNETIEKICSASKQYCLYMLDEWAEFGMEVPMEFAEDTPDKEILKHIHPTTLIIEEPKENIIGYHLECECDWEPEHGLELTLRDGKLIYCGSFECCDAWQKYSTDDEFNFVNCLID